jgi:hypothetical protein
MLGTLIGAAATIALIPNLVDAPELLSLAIALWVGVCLYLSLIDGTPRGYVFMLSGYTVALLGFPVLSMPGSMFDIVVARVREIMLGIICASVVSMLVMPRSVVSVIAAQADRWLADARQLGVDVLTGRGGEQERDNERMRLAAAASEIDQLGLHLDYESHLFANPARSLRRLQPYMLLLLPLLAAIEDQRAVLISHEDMPASLAGIGARVVRWLADGGRDQAEADELRAALDELQPQLGADARWIDIAFAAFVVWLRKLVDVVRSCQLLREAIADGRDPGSLALAFIWIAERLLRGNWQTLSVVADARSQQDRVAVPGLMQHRLALLAARITVVPAEARSHAANLRQLRTALNIIDVRQASLALSRPAMAAIDDLLTRLASACRTHRGGRLPDQLAERLDRTIASTLQDPSGEGRNQALIGLAGIRAGLFREAAPDQPHEPEPRRVAA